MMMPDVLTLEEVAVYLRLPKETIQREATRGRIPGRQIDDTWRFLKAAIDDWLRSCDSRTILLKHAGALAAAVHWAPFDRTLVCQAIAHVLTVVTVDPVFEAYSAPLLGRT
jgi:excisionase family DNA binding protein